VSKVRVTIPLTNNLDSLPNELGITKPNPSTAVNFDSTTCMSAWDKNEGTRGTQIETEKTKKEVWGPGKNNNQGGPFSASPL
jgi:hypothetical protein